MSSTLVQQRRATGRAAPRLALASLAAALGLAALAGGASAEPNPEPCLPCVAMVNGDASVARQEGVVAVTRVSEGYYDVKFRSSLARCYWLSSLSDAGVGPGVPGLVAAAARGGVATDLYVKTYASDGRLADHGFSVTAICPESHCGRDGRC